MSMVALGSVSSKPSLPQMKHAFCAVGPGDACDIGTVGADVDSDTTGGDVSSEARMQPHIVVIIRGTDGH